MNVRVLGLQANVWPCGAQEQQAVQKLPRHQDQDQVLNCEVVPVSRSVLMFLQTKPTSLRSEVKKLISFRNLLLYLHSKHPVLDMN